MSDGPKNLPRQELMEHAADALKRIGGNGQVFFKFTCPVCGERVTFAEPNILYEEGECCNCGHTSPVTEGGYLLHMMPQKPHNPELN